VAVKDALDKYVLESDRRQGYLRFS
jgi:hypothetical protein